MHYINGVNSEASLALVWKKVQKLSGKFVRHPVPNLKIGDQLVTDPDSVADIFGEHFANVSDPSHYPTRLQSIKDAEVLVSMESGGLEDYNCTFSLHELHSALSSAESTAPGKDNIIYDMLKHSLTKAKNFLINIFNRIWETGVLPKSW